MADSTPTSALDGGASDPDVGGQCEVGDPVASCPGPQMAYIVVHVQDTSGKPIQGVDVTVLGQGWNGTTDSSGNFDFGEHPAGPYTVQGLKTNYQPAPQSETKSAAASTTTSYQLVLTPPKVVRINAKLPTTQSARGKNAGGPPFPTHDFSSASSDKSLAGNKPTVLVRNCADISLEAVTDPPGVADVVWKVEANPGGDSTPSVSPTTGLKARLKTNAAGGYAVSASLPGTTVYWNLVLFEVKIDKSAIQRASTVNGGIDTGYGIAEMSTGVFDVTNPAVCGMYARADVTLTAGSRSSLDVYADEITVGTAQNMLSEDTITGNYDGGGHIRSRYSVESIPGTPIVTDPSVKVTDLGYPILDTGRGGTSGGDSIFLGRTRSTPETGTKRLVETCDSPGQSFPLLLPEFGKVASKRMQSMSGSVKFTLYLAAYSDFAKYSYVVFGSVSWQYELSGSVAWAKDGTPSWTTSTTAGVTGKGTGFTEIAGGEEAKAAGCEVYPPVELDPHWIFDAR